MRWKNVVEGDIFYADSRYRHTTDEKRAAVRVINMWNPAYRFRRPCPSSYRFILQETAGASSPVCLF